MQPERVKSFYTLYAGFW